MVGVNPMDATRVARVGLSRVLEPRDGAGHVLLMALGAVAAWEVISGARGVRGGEHELIERALREEGRAFAGTWASAAQRWVSRAQDCDPAADLDRAARTGIWVCTPEDSDWPTALNDLGLQMPVCLWGRGQRQRLAGLGDRSVAVVGSRDCSSYGRTVTYELAGGLAARGWSVISGGAYGVDEAAHRAALATGTAVVPTVAVMAGGVDRFYPRGNEELLQQVMADGLVLSEAAPGTMPARFRFLDRNRLIAALARATLVTESRWRSGAQSTAHHANGLSRPVGAVPGSVQSATSAGCHRLIREGSAVLVTDIEDFLSLAGPLGDGAIRAGRSQESLTTEDPGTVRQCELMEQHGMSVERGKPVGQERPVGQGDSVGRGESARHTEPAGTDDPAGTEERAEQLAIFDGLSEADRQLADALPVARGATVDSLATVSGLPIRMILGGLRRLERQGLAVDRGGLWLRPRRR